MDMQTANDFNGTEDIAFVICVLNRRRRELSHNFALGMKIVSAIRTLVEIKISIEEMGNITDLSDCDGDTKAQILENAEKLDAMERQKHTENKNSDTNADINDNYRKRSVATDKKGNPLAYAGEVLWKVEKDSARASRHMIVEALQYPNLKDKELMDFYHCVDVTDMPLLVFPRADEYAYVTKAVMTALGLMDDISNEETVNEAKN